MSTDDQTRSATHRIRASDAEREQVATIVRAAMGDGRLNLADGEDRLAQVYAATYRDDLRPLTADLPDDARLALAETPEARVARRRTGRRRAAIAALVALVVIGLAALPGVHFWPVGPLIFLMVVLHARGRRRWHGCAPAGTVEHAGPALIVRDTPPPWRR